MTSKAGRICDGLLLGPRCYFGVMLIFFHFCFITFCRKDASHVQPPQRLTESLIGRAPGCEWMWPEKAATLAQAAPHLLPRRTQGPRTTRLFHVYLLNDRVAVLYLLAQGEQCSGGGGGGIYLRKGRWVHGQG